MKKILSMLLIMIMAMSIFCAVPASATTIGRDKYRFIDFETEYFVSSTGFSGSPKLVSGGAFGSAKALKYVDNGNPAMYNIAGKTKWLIGTGETLTVSGKINFTKYTGTAATNTIRLLGGYAAESNGVNVGYLQVVAIILLLTYQPIPVGSHSLFRGRIQEIL